MKTVSIKLNQVMLDHIEFLRVNFIKEGFSDMNTSQVIKTCIQREYLRQQKN